MFGWTDNPNNGALSDCRYMVYFLWNDLNVYGTDFGNTSLKLNSSVVGTMFRCRMQLLTGGGCELQVYKDGNYTIPYATHTFGEGASGIDTLYPGNQMYDGGTPVVEYQSMTVGMGLPTGTIISGDILKTGIIRSNNWNGETQGTQIDLDNGQIRAKASGFEIGTQKGSFDFSVAGIAAAEEGIVYPDDESPTPNGGGGGSSGGGSYNSQNQNPA